MAQGSGDALDESVEVLVQNPEYITKTVGKQQGL